jgi:hypothetical protein
MNKALRRDDDQEKDDADPIKAAHAVELPDYLQACFQICALVSFAENGAALCTLLFESAWSI